MKLRNICIAAIALISVWSAQIVNAQGFSGPYAPANWVLSNPVGGSVNTSGAPANIVLSGPNGFGAGNLNYAYTFTTCTQVSFSWNCVHPDPTWDNLLYGVNGTFTFLTDVTASGSVGPLTFNAGDVLTFRINTEDGGFGGPTVTFSNFIAIAAPNNACTGASAINPGVTSGNTAAFCASPDVAPSCGTAADATGAGLWHSYTPSCSGSVNASLCTGTTFNTQLRVYSGTCGALTCIDGNDDFCGTQSQVTWAGTGGVTYYILVHGSGTDEGTYNLTLTQTDLTAPVANVAPLPDATGSCSVTVTTPTASDNCSGTINGTTPDPTTYTTPGSYVVTWTYNDGNGNTSTQTQNVIVDPDVIAPTIGCTNDTTLVSQPDICGTVVNYQTPACPFTGMLYDQSFDALPLDNGYFITSSFPDFIADDFVIPGGDCWILNNFSANIWTQGIGMTSLVVNIHDDAGGEPGTIVSTQTLTSANWTSTFVGNVGAYTIRDYDFTLTTPVNICSGTYWLSIYDNVAPFNNVAWSIRNPITNNPAQQSVNGTENGPWAPNGNDFVFNVSGTKVGTVSDNCPQCPNIVQTSGLPSGSVFPVGTTTNTFVATDIAGNSSSCSFDVIVNDATPPATSGGALELSIIFGAFWLDVTTWELYDANNTLVASGGPYGNGTPGTIVEQIDISGAIEPLTFNGETVGPPNDNVLNYQVTCGPTVISSGSITGGTTGSFTDIQGCAVTLPDMNDACSVTLGSPLPTLNDNCDGPVDGTTTDPLTYSTNGTYIVTWTFADANGNTSTLTQTVTISDSLAPVPDVANLATASANCTVTLSSTPTATDNCAGTITATTTDSTTYNTAGTYTVTWTYDDTQGNISTQTQTVVVTDDTSPVPDHPILATAVGNCVVTVDDIPTATDNCVGTITATTTDPISYNLIGTFFIIWHFDDGNGNTWTQNQVVIVNPCLGLDDESGQWNALIYPNPSSGIFTLSLSEMPVENTQVRLVDALGQVLYSEVLQGQIQQFDFSHLASATYYLLVTSDHGQISKPIIIRQNY